MKIVTIKRTSMGDDGTFGTLEVDGETFVTGELPWRDNKCGRSCIPAGVYAVSWEPSGKYGHKYEVQGVAGRSDILLHAANFVGDRDKGRKAQVDGCIALGGSISRMENQTTVMGSKSAVEKFEALLNKEPFKLVVIDEYLEAGEVPKII
jgi:hypothetical protein